LKKMIKKFNALFGVIAALIIALGILVPATPAMAADTTVSIDPATPIIVTAGDDFVMYLDLNIGSGVEMDTIGFQLDWNGPTGALTCDWTTGGINRSTGTGSFWDGIPSYWIQEQLGDFGSGTTTQQFAWSLKADTSTTPPTPRSLTGPLSGHVAEIHFHADTDGEVTITPFDVQFALEGNPAGVFNLATGTVYVGGMPAEPDLVILEKHEEWVVPGQTFNIVYTVKNQGDGDAGASYTQLTIDGDYLDSWPCPALDSEDTFTDTIGPWDFDPDLSGSDIIVLCADTDSQNAARDNQVDESDENNNCKENTWANNRIYVDAPATVTQGHTVDVAVNLSSMPPTRGAGFKVRWNEGSGELTLTGISENESAQSFFDPYLTLFQSGGAAVPTEEMSEQCAVTLKQTTPPGPDYVEGRDGGLATLHFLATGAGTVDLYFEDVQIVGVDEYGDQVAVTVVESEPVTIDILQSDFIDIEAVSKSERFDIEAGVPVYYVDFVVRNNGTLKPGEGTQITIYENGEVLEVIGWSGDAGATLTSSSGPWPVPATLGDTEIKLFADSRNDALESNEDNNILINTLPYLPNLRIVDKWEVETGPGEYQIMVTVRNIGPADCPATSLLGFYIDGSFVDNSTVIPALAAGVSQTLQYPTGSSSITMSGIQDFVRVVADDGGDIIEWNEEDNDREQIYSYIDDSCKTPITGQPLPVIDITCAGPIDGWYWEIGQNFLTRTYNVKANTDWQVEAEDSDDQTAGYMTEWDGTDYYDLHLTHPMDVSAADGGGPMTDRWVIKYGEVEDQDVSDGEDFDVEFCQEVELQDPAYPEDGHVYHMEVTFIAGASF
jgi:hypothetical protein